MTPPTAAASSVSTGVLVVGAGPTGLALSLALHHAGVDHLVVEKHPSTTNHPKATYVNPRTMELFCEWGIAQEVLDAGIPATTLDCISWSTALAGLEITRLDLRQSDDQLAAMRQGSPTEPCFCPQDVLEPILRRAVDARGVNLRFGCELVDFEQDDEAVRANVRDRTTSEVTEVNAAWLVGCDGRTSVVRDGCGIPLQGREPLGEMLNIYVRADVTHLIGGRLAPLYWIINPDIGGVLITLNGTDRWLLNLPYQAHRGETLDDYPPERCVELVRRAIGDEHVVVEVVDVHAWSMTRVVADSFRIGRVFLAGDAAHQFPPTGGHGMNSGIQDAHNLGWKLAAVSSGWADDRLLDSYEAERRPVALRNTSESSKNAEAMRGGITIPPAIEDDTDEGAQIRELVAGAVSGERGHFISPGLALGAGYESDAVIADPTFERADESTDERYVPLAKPGHRAPHLWVRTETGEERSLFTRFGAGFVLLTADPTERWLDATTSAHDQLGVGVEAVRIGVDLTEDTPRFAASYELAPDAAVLVRPDGYVAWRSPDSCRDPAAALADALSGITGRPAARPTHLA